MIRENGIWSPDNLRPAETHINAITLATSASEAIGGSGNFTRQPLAFQVATQTAKRALATQAASIGGLIEGDTVLVRADGGLERWTGSVWRLQRTITPRLYSNNDFLVPGQAQTIGNGLVNVLYWVDDEKVYINGTFTYGSTTSGYWGKFPPAPGFPVLDAGVQNGVVGTATYLKSGNFYHGRVMVRGPGLGTSTTEGVLELPYDNGTSQGRSGGATDPNPPSLAAGDWFSVNLAYQRLN